MATYVSPISEPTPLGSVQPAQPFEPEKAAEGLRKAMKGLGTNEESIIKIMASHCVEQRVAIDRMYKQMYGRDLCGDLTSELSGNFENLTIALLDPPRVYDAKECNEAVKGAGTNEETLIEILTTRSNTEIAQIRAEYKRLFKRELERDIQSDTSGDLKRLLTSLVTGNREERLTPDVDLAKKEAQELFKAGEKSLGTDESTFNRILCLRSSVQLRETFTQYKNYSGKDMEHVIRAEMSGNLALGCLAIVKSSINPTKFFAERLHHSMEGAGTKDNALIRQIVSRIEVDMVTIKKEFHNLYGKTLSSFIKGDTGGDYRKLLMALVGE